MTVSPVSDRATIPNAVFQLPAQSGDWTVVVVASVAVPNVAAVLECPPPLDAMRPMTTARTVPPIASPTLLYDRHHWLAG